MISKSRIFSNYKILLVFVIGFSVYTPLAFGHGLGLDTISSIAIDDKEISVIVEIPSYYDQTDQRQVTITAVEQATKEKIKNVTYLIGLFHDGEMIFRNYFFTADGYLSMNVKSADTDSIDIAGTQDPSLGAWYGTEQMPLEITGPVFESAGLYTFEIEIRTIDEPTNVIEGLDVYTADITIVGTTEFIAQDLENNDVDFAVKSYFDTVDSFVYDPVDGIVTFEMPFDWSEKQISHIPVVHEEVHFPKDFVEFLAPSYLGTINGIELFKSSISVDDYTDDSERLVHFVLSKEDIRYIKNQLKELGMPTGDKMIFTLKTDTAVTFPISAWTRDELLRVDLFWDPLEIAPQQKTKFIFTIRNALTAEPLRNSVFDFVIMQNTQEIYRESVNAQIGGDFIDYTFTEDQTGPTVIRFENIRNTGQSTEFGIVVIPEFGLIASLILVAGMSSVVLFGKKYLHSY